MTGEFLLNCCPRYAQAFTDGCPRHPGISHFLNLGDFNFVKAGSAALRAIASGGFGMFAGNHDTCSYARTSAGSHPISPSAYVAHNSVVSWSYRKPRGNSPRGNRMAKISQFSESHSIDRNPVQSTNPRFQVAFCPLTVVFIYLPPTTYTRLTQQRIQGKSEKKEKWL
jgi:hypothetical protein